MRTRWPSLAAFALLLVCRAEVRAELDVDDDYYAGFAQGTYYGLLLAGEDYDVAWCMRGELAYEAKGMGLGVEFQRAMERLLSGCRAEYGKNEGEPDTPPPAAEPR